VAVAVNSDGTVAEHIGSDQPTIRCWEIIDRILSDVRVVIAAGMGENSYVGLLKRNVLPLVTEEIDHEKALH
jgi:hypothetical protein